MIIMIIMIIIIIIIMIILIIMIIMIIVISRQCATGVCEKALLRIRRPLGGYWLEEHQIRWWRAVSAARLQGNSTQKRNVVFTDTGSTLSTYYYQYYQYYDY